MYPIKQQPQHHYKLNIDASWFPDGLGAVAAMLRNDQGEAIAALQEVDGH
jgi:hypothetical protein